MSEITYRTGTFQLQDATALELRLRKALENIEAKAGCGEWQTAAVVTKRP